MRNLGLALLLLGGLAASAWAGDTAVVPTTVIPSEFHWIHRTPTTVYYFDCKHGAWNCRLTNHRMTVGATGTMAVKDRAPFYEALAANHCWELPTAANVDSQHYDKATYSYVVATPHYEHHAYFNDVAPYAAFMTYVNGTLVGQEENALLPRLK